MTFLRPALLILGVVLPLLLGGAIFLFVRRRRRFAAAFGDPGIVRRLAGASLLAVPWRRVAALLLAAAVLGLAAAGPQWGRGGDDTGTGADVVLLLDVSNSMLVADAVGGAGPVGTRLEQQQRTALQIASTLGGSRIGLVVFAGRAYVVSPLTADRGATEMFIEAAAPDIVQQTGTSLAAAIRQGTNLLALGDSLGPPRQMVLISDGDALEERADVLAAARRATAAGVQIYTLQTGTAQGGPVPDIDFSTGEQLGYKTDPETGRTAISAANDEVLRDVARITGGRYAPLGDSDALSALLQRMQVDGDGTPGGQGNGGRPLYPWLVAAALILLALDAAHDVLKRARAG